ncbi:helix-turn-helix domain-containing protein [Paenibacillus contaminans]|uniref:DUF559 domain-containing protein n=1 Tax=Paenibacillus contaminans TaxID=450362 RepID=A0A329LVR3_9BACL|nr:helix-turn-helix domain-containing protein [Paenibacillus contaminans]RAV11260.1 hypothetical protein DQG23_36665 [Paenibacillus contaminans]
MHPNLARFIEHFEQEASLKGLYRNKLGKSELMFLTEVWGPAFQNNFYGLKAEYPLKDFKGGQRFVDFVYIKGGVRLLMEIDGYTTHARDISPGDFDDHLSRQNDLVLSGWLLLRFSSNQVEKRSYMCQRQIKQAIGHWFAIMQHGFTSDEANPWKLRKQLIIQLAMNTEGRIKPCEVAEAFKVSNSTAVVWLKRFASEGELIPSSNGKRVMYYTLPNFSKTKDNQPGNP